MGEDNKNRELVNSLVKEQPITRAIQKLNRKPLKVSVYRHLSLVGALEEQALDLEQALAAKDESNKTEIQARIDETKANLEKLDADKIDGYLTHLTYRDINDIKAAVTEAIIHFQEYGFDMNVIMARVTAEERFMTVFCALKQASDPATRYFSKLDDIAELDEATVFDLYSKWEQHFVLSEDEVKK